MGKASIKTQCISSWGLNYIFVSSGMLRPWAGKLYRKLGKADKVKLGLTSEGVVTRKRKADGTLSVLGS